MNKIEYKHVTIERDNGWFLVFGKPFVSMQDSMRYIDSLHTEAVYEYDLDVCNHDEFDHDICLDCGYERDPGEQIDKAMDAIDLER